MNAQPSFAAHHARKARYWLLRLKSGEISAREVARLKAWLAKDVRHQSAFVHERTFLQGLAQQHELFRNVAVAAQATSLRRRWCVQMPLWQGPALACAAVLVLVLGLLSPQLWLTLRADYRSGNMPSSFTLDDGTQVALDADSAIKVDYSDRERRIELLRGRAWFDVASAKTRPFEVVALQGRSRDIGTRFEVAVIADEVHTTVAQGIVEVSSQHEGNAELRLQAGQMAHYRRGGPVVGPALVDMSSIAAWRNGEILLQGASPRSAIEQIARYYDKPVWVLGDIDQGRTISGLFHTRQSAQSIQLIVGQLGLKLRQLPGGVLLIHAG